jgi:O-succinylbenzoate synthase
MKIDQITLYHLDMPLVHPFETSFGLETRRQCLILSAQSGDLIGWGECVAMQSPAYSSETCGTAWHVLEQFLIPATNGEEWIEISDFVEKTNWVRGHHMAKAALQGAAWDLLAQSQGINLAALLAERYPEEPKKRVKVGISIGIQPSITETLTRIEKFLAKGFDRVKLKIKPGWDLDLLHAVREAFPKLDLMVDANAAYTSQDYDFFRKMDQFNLMMIEQPLAYDDIYHHSQLQQEIQTPICLDESISTLDQARSALELDACRIINIKPGRVGGFWESIQIHDLCLENGIPVWCGGMLETGIGRAGNLALASLPNFSLPGDIGPTHRYWEKDIIDEVFYLNKVDSTITVPEGPGLGISVNPERLENYLLRKQEYCSS